MKLNEVGNFMANRVSTIPLLPIDWHISCAPERIAFELGLLEFPAYNIRIAIVIQ